LKIGSICSEEYGETMSEVSESITRGLDEALEYAKGNLECRSFVVKDEPVTEYAPEENKECGGRNGQLGLS
jgi:hypothetical protein